MIVGIGIDLCRINRVRRSVARLGDAWIEELFTSQDRDHCLASADSGLAFARGFACKEAAAKALGSGFAKGVSPRDIVLSSNHGFWEITFQGNAQTRLRRMTPAGHTPRCRVAVTMIGEFLSCTVVIEAVMKAKSNQFERR